MDLSRGGAMLLAVAVLAAGCVQESSAPTSSTSTSPAPASELATPATPTDLPVPPTAPARGEDPGLADPASIAVVVNKRRPLVPPDWAPPSLEDVEGHQLQPAAAAAARGMLAEARAAGVPVRIVSGYRSYDVQAATYAGWVAQLGRPQADAVSARPGHSEHQTGLAVDVGDGSPCDLRACFARTAAAAWVAEHGPEHGFVVRYPPGEQDFTGYRYEPWHLRYLGPGPAQDFVRSGIGTLEEFSGLGPAPDYGRPASGSDGQGQLAFDD